jgi:hypothetical protein
MMDARPTTDGRYQVTLDHSEVVTLYEFLARNEWSNDLVAFDTQDAAEKTVLSRVQMALRPLVRDLGSDRYGESVKSAWAELESGNEPG